jgi:peptidoglycan/xylan/chitin deacetylase (PgdA/CDA1 family)
MAEKLTILMYHKIEPLHAGAQVPGHYVDPATFRKQMAVLRRFGYRSVRLADAVTQPLPKRPVVISFDDGYRNFQTNALPVLKEYGFGSTVFLVSEQIGGDNRWDVLEGDVSESLMNQEEIAACIREGVEFGSHSSSHARLTQVDQSLAWSEISDSKSSLEAKFRIPITTFCYPYGAQNEQTRRMVEKAGYVCACSTDKGINDSTTDRFALRRINVRRDTMVAGFVMKLWRAKLLGR